VLILPLLTACPEPCNKPPFSAFTGPLYLAFKGEWLDLAYRISGFWAVGSNLQFQRDVRGHERSGRTAEKHGETEAMRKSANSSSPVPGPQGKGREAEDTITR
jgi:hypothetical protein